MRVWRRFPLSISLLIAVVVCVVGIVALDLPIAQWMKAHAGETTLAVFVGVSKIGEAQYYLVPSGLLALWCLWRVRRSVAAERALWQRRLVAPAYMFLTIASSGIVVNVLKVMIGRLRPRHFFADGLYGFEPFNTVWSMNSFPSGHSQAAFAAFAALAFIFPRWAVLWLSVAVLVAFSRIVITVHYFSDTVAGAWIGVAAAVLLARYCDRRGWSLRGADAWWRQL